jgi:hypothetical protein
VTVIEALNQAIERASGIRIVAAPPDCIRCTIEPSIERNLSLSCKPITIWVVALDRHPKLLEIGQPRRGIPYGGGGK